jgi:AAA+ ATPase superfamily predicted ATPase
MHATRHIKQSLIGRESALTTLKQAQQSGKAELVIVLGRRRVGKTFLIEQFIASEHLPCLAFVGQRNTSDVLQRVEACTVLQEFSKTFGTNKEQKNEVSKKLPWRDIFAEITSIAERQPQKQLVVFFDEFPWLARRRSSFLKAFDYVWNKKWSKFPNLKIIVCGSATSWLLEKFLGDKGGLHNRNTRRISLSPFSLKEAEQYLKYNGFKYSRKQIIEITLALGGIPYYLNWLRPEESPAQNINRLLNTNHAELALEYQFLLQALFRDDKDQDKVLSTLAKHRQGLSRQDLLLQSGIEEGEHAQNLLNELVACSFVAKYIPFSRKKRDSYYRLLDEYVLFYKYWIEQERSQALVQQKDRWLKVITSARYYSWAGCSFETLCQREVNAILDHLKISGMQVNVSNWRSKEGDAQVDLVLDRADGIVNLVEIKYTTSPLEIDQTLIRKVKEREAKFIQSNKIKKNVSTILISAAGVSNVGLAQEVFSATLDLNCLFEAN